MKKAKPIFKGLLAAKEANKRRRLDSATLKVVRDHVRATLGSIAVNSPAELGFAAAFKEIRAIVDPVKGDVSPVGRQLIDRFPRATPRKAFPLLFDPNVRYAERRNKINEISYGVKRRKIIVDTLNPWHDLAWNITEQGRLVKTFGIKKATAIAESVGSYLGATKPSPNFDVRSKHSPRWLSWSSDEPLPAKRKRKTPVKRARKAKHT
jgi:hypothetical protein